MQKLDKQITIMYSVDMQEAVEQYRIDSGIGSIGGVIRFAVQNFLQDEGYLK